jgi:outer membrane receptor protein involved in Fe transport
MERIQKMLMRARPVFVIVIVFSSRQAVMAQNISTAAASEAIDLPEIVIEGDAVSPLQAKMDAFDRSRNGLLPKIGATSFALDTAAIQALPQGKDTPIDKMVLQAPGISYDSAVSNPDFHVRNEYANTQTRINGIMLPEGVSGLGPVLETGFIGKFDLLTGALPAQYGLRTAGVLDLTTKSQFAPGGGVSLYAGSFNTFSPSFEYSGSGEKTQYYFTGRYMQNDQGLENSTPSAYAIHDKTEQGKYFGYVSTLLGDSSRLTFMSGASDSRFQIPNTPGQTPLGDFGPAAFDSTLLNENERDTFLFNILALQTKGDDFDTQLSVFSRYADTHFVPDSFGDLVFNDVASDVQRKSLLNGIQFDGSKRLNEAHALRAGFDVTAEQTNVNNTSTVLPGAVGAVTGPPITITDADSKLGWNLGVYLQDEWKLTETLTLNTGVRFDQLDQFVDENQVSPRIALVEKPFENTSLHIGYARYFTPPMQAQAAPSNVAAFNGTTQQPAVAGNSPVLPERSHYFDAGVDQKVLPGFTVGADVYYKIATDLLDDGQFGQALVLTQFNYAKAYSEGVELKAQYRADGFTAYGNFSANQTEAKEVVSNQYLFSDPVEFAYIANNYHYTDDAQIFTASAGTSYRWNKTQFSADSIYGSGLRSGFANLQHVAPYNTVNLGLSRDFDLGLQGRPLTVRFSVVNLFDTIYLLRSGSGIGEFAPQYGQRRGVFVSLSQKL